MRQFGMRTFGAVALVLCVWAVGCGTVQPASTAPAATGTLNGNWLLTGTLPFLDPLNFGASQGFGISMTFTTTGSQLAAGGSIDYPCGNFVVGGSGNVVTGTIATDGTFTAQSPAIPPGGALVLRGSVPAAGASTWNGSYSFTPSSTTCPQALTGSFTATRIADLTGTYATTAPVTLNPVALNGTTASGAAQTVSLTFSLMQGGVVAGTTTVDPQLLSGSVTITGSSCFQTGTAAATAGSGLLGSTFLLAYTLNDGSKMQFVGDMEDVGASKVVVRDVLLSGGVCGTMNSAPFEMVRQ